MADDPMHDDATTAFLFQCGKSDLLAVSRDQTGGNIPREECTEGWLLRETFRLGVRESVPVARRRMACWPRRSRSSAGNFPRRRVPHVGAHLAQGSGAAGAGMREVAGFGLRAMREDDDQEALTLRRAL